MSRRRKSGREEGRGGISLIVKGKSLMLDYWIAEKTDIRAAQRCRGWCGSLFL
jgi:hypothetical protein